MNIRMPSLIQRFLGAARAASVTACALLPSGSGPQTLDSEQIRGLLASPERSAADRSNDQRRKPEQMLAFIGIRPAA